jgi:hypothetical protein
MKEPRGAAIIQCNEWAVFFIHLNRLERKPGNEKNQNSNLTHGKNSSTMYDDAWQIFCLTRNLQIQRKEIARPSHGSQKHRSFNP